MIQKLVLTLAAQHLPLCTLLVQRAHLCCEGYHCCIVRCQVMSSNSDIGALIFTDSGLLYGYRGQWLGSTDGHIEEVVQCNWVIDLVTVAYVRLAIR